MSAPRTMALGAFLMAGGHHIAAWRHPDAETTAGSDIRHLVGLAQMAEAAKFDLVFFEDAAAIREKDPEIASQAARSTGFEPLTLLAALATATTRIGLVATASTSYNEPAVLARTLASIDALSAGRAGWNLVTSASELEAANFGGGGLLAPLDRYRRAEGFADQAFAWWGANAGRRPVLVQAGASEAGLQLAARTAEIVFTLAQTLEESLAYARDLRSRLAAFGRAPDAIRIMPGIAPYVAESADEAQEQYETLQALIPDAVGVALLASYLSHPDIAKLPLDGPLPDMPENAGMQSRQKLVVEMARSEGLSIREAARRFAGARGHWQVVGTPRTVADAMEERFSAGAADGFNVMAPFFPGGLRAFIRLVVPELRRRGLVRGDYAGATLRDHLRLPEPGQP